jgi:hypothetical protein
MSAWKIHCFCLFRHCDKWTKMDEWSYHQKINVRTKVKSNLHFTNHRLLFVNNVKSNVYRHFIFRRVFSLSDLSRSVLQSNKSWFEFQSVNFLKSGIEFSCFFMHTLGLKSLITSARTMNGIISKLLSISHSMIHSLYVFGTNISRRLKCVVWIRLFLLKSGII